MGRVDRNLTAIVRSRIAIAGRGARPLIAGMVLLLALTCGCGGAGIFGAHPRNPEYGFGFYNASDQQLTGAKIAWTHRGDPVEIEAGLVPPQLDHIWHFAPDPIPAKATVSWETPDGKRHNRPVEVAAKVADLDHFTGTFWLKFTGGDAVELVPVTEAEADERVKQFRPYRPD